MNGVIFDCDGVLVDSEKFSCGAWIPVLARRGIQVTLADIEAFIGQSDRAVLQHYSQITGTPLDPADILPEREQQYFDMARGKLKSFAHLPQTLIQLQRRHTPLAVASSGEPDKIRFSLGQTGLSQFFPVVCSAAEVEQAKPAPDLFLLAAQRLGLEPSNCAVIEDSVPGIEAANAAGMHSFGFVSSHPAQTLRDAGAQQVFTNYGTLVDLLVAAGIA